MVHLTMTRTIVEAIKKCKAISSHRWNSEELGESTSLEAPTLGKPISHSQIVAISKFLRKHNTERCTADPQNGLDSPNFHLDTLLRGARVYIESPQPKTEPVSIASYRLHPITDWSLFRHRSTKR